MVAFQWLSASPHRFKTFVVNRVTKIVAFVSANKFYHIPDDQNPSDCFSRGLTPAQIIDHPLWFTGPQWLNEEFCKWAGESVNEFNSVERPELKKIITLTAVTNTIEENPYLRICENVSSWSKLLCLVVCIYRYLKVLPVNKFITADDLKFAETKFIKALQYSCFLEEIKNIK